MTTRELLRETQKSQSLERLPLAGDFELRAHNYEADIKSLKIQTEHHESPGMKYTNNSNDKELELQNSNLKTQLIPSLLKKQTTSSKKQQSSFFQRVEAFSPKTPNFNNVNKPYNIDSNYLPLDTSDTINPNMRPGTIMIKIDNKIVRFEGPIEEPKAFQQFDPALTVEERQTLVNNLPQIMEYKQADNIIADRFGPFNNSRMHYFNQLKTYAASYKTIVSKFYHLPEFGFPIESYGVTDSQLAFLQNSNLRYYVSRGGKLLNEECLQMLIKVYQDFFEKNLPTVNVNGAFQGQRATIIHNETGNGVMIFRQSKETNTLRTHFELSRNHRIRYLREGSIGVNKTALAEGTKPPTQINFRTKSSNLPNGNTNNLDEKE